MDRHQVVRKAGWTGTEKIDEATLGRLVSPLLSAP